MPAFRLGLVGAGRMGRMHLRALAGSDRVAVTAIAEPSAAARTAPGGPGIAPGVTLHASPAQAGRMSAEPVSGAPPLRAGYRSSFANRSPTC